MTGWRHVQGRTLTSLARTLRLAACLSVALLAIRCGGGGSPSPPPPTPSPAASLSPASVSIGSQQVATTSAAHTVTLSNTGNAALSITSITLTGTNSGDFAQTNSCGASLAAGSNCAIKVTFTPTATGARSGALSVADNAAGSPQTVSLSGTGTAPPVAAVSLSPTSISFWNQVGASSSASVTLSNTGGGAVTITGVAITGSTDFAGTTDCSSTLGASSICTINVTFTPTTAGAQTATLSVSDNAPGSPQTVGLTVGSSSTSGTVSVAPGSASAGVNIAVSAVNPVTMLLQAVGICILSGTTLNCQTTASGAEVAQGKSATLLLAGKGIVSATVYSITGNQNGISVTQPASTDFQNCNNSGGGGTTPCVTLDISVSASATPGPRNIVVTNPAGEMSVFVGGLEITQ